MSAFSARTAPMLALCRTTVAEAVRSKILYGVALFALGLILFSAVLSQITLGHQVRIVTDVSLSATSLAGTLMAVLLGVGSVAREVERRTYYPVLAKPIGRAEYVLGKWLGVVATVWLNVAVMLVLSALMIAAYSHDGAFQYDLGDFLVTCGLTLLRLAVIAAIAVAFSTFASSTVALIGSVGVVVAGFFTAEVRYFMAKTGRGNQLVGDALYFVLPDFQAIDGLSRLVHGDHLGLGALLAPAAYAVTWSAFLLLAACVIFSRRDLS